MEGKEDIDFKNMSEAERETYLFVHEMYKLRDEDDYQDSEYFDMNKEDGCILLDLIDRIDLKDGEGNE